LRASVEKRLAKLARSALIYGKAKKRFHRTKKQQHLLLLLQREARMPSACSPVVVVVDELSVLFVFMEHREKKIQQLLREGRALQRREQAEAARPLTHIQIHEFEDSFIDFLREVQKKTPAIADLSLWTTLPIIGGPGLNGQRLYSIWTHQEDDVANEGGLVPLVYKNLFLELLRDLRQQRHATIVFAANHDARTVSITYRPPAPDAAPPSP
jgi:hypothetical protein